jgi:murein DD-endopeptidase MepM/ murein hydrolase activator NlpD
MRTRVLLPAVAAVAAASLSIGSFLSIGPLGPTDAGASTTSTTSAASAASSGTRTYIVRPGDSVQSIARRFGVSADDLRVANGIVGDQLYRGAQLVIQPGAASGRSSSTVAMRRISSTSKASTSASSKRTSLARATSGSYTVEAGDYLEGIAHRHGLKLSTLLAANHLKATSLILPGDRLTIPASSASDSAGTSSTGNASSGSSDSSSSSGSSGSSGSSLFGAMGTSLRCPVPSATFMNDWGFPRDGGTRFHEGNDLFAPKGTTIYAPASGTIVYSRNGLGGSSFNIVTSTGWNIYGAHMSATIGSNRHVTVGEPIGRVGNTGDAAGGPTHLHVQLRRVNGKPINPYPSLLAACG